jgi:hypothetical protein
MMPDAPRRATFESDRLATVEAETAATRRHLDDLTRNFGVFAGEIRDSISKLTDRMATSQRANWPLVVSSVGVATTLIVVIIGGASWGFIRDLDENRENTSALIETMRDHMASEGHPVAIAVQGKLDERVGRVAETQQRIDARLDAIEASRFRYSDGERLRDQVEDLRVRLAVTERLAEDLAADRRIEGGTQ